MATIIVPADGATVSGVTLNDTLQADPSVNINSIPVFYEVDGTSKLQSLYIGYDVEVDIGFLASGSLTGTGSITGATNATVGNLPLVDNYGLLDINGSITTSYSNDGQTTVSSGERLDLKGDLFSLGTITVAANGELDLDNPNSAFISNIAVSGKLKSATKAATLQATTNSGTIDITAGTLALAATVTGNGAIIVESGAKLDMSAAQSVAGTVVLNAGSKLTVSQTTSFTGTLQGPAASATIDLINFNATGAKVSNGQILVASASGTFSLNETGLTQGLILPVASDGSGGTLISLGAIPTQTPTPTPTPTGTGTSPGASSDPAVYRFFDKVHGTQFLTASSTEAASLQATTTTLSFEGVGLYSVNNATDPNATPVYRFFDKVYGTHFYTSSAAESQAVQATRFDLAYEGIGFYEHQTKQSGDVPVYRFFDSNNGTHFFTSSAAEQASVIASRPDLVSEGVGFYAPTS